MANGKLIARTSFGNISLFRVDFLAVCLTVCSPLRFCHSISHSFMNRSFTLNDNSLPLPTKTTLVDFRRTSQSGDNLYRCSCGLRTFFYICRLDGVGSLIRLFKNFGICVIVLMFFRVSDFNLHLQCT